MKKSHIIPLKAFLAHIILSSNSNVILVKVDQGKGYAFTENKEYNAITIYC